LIIFYLEKEIAKKQKRSILIRKSQKKLTMILYRNIMDSIRKKVIIIEIINIE
jgi:hypothetical protein